MHVKVSHLSKAYGKKVILEDVSFQIQPGEIVGLVAPNGMGKTTLMRVMMNLEEADAGEVTFNGVKNTDKNIFNEIGYMHDAPVLDKYLTARQHLNLLASLRGLDIGQVQALIDELEMDRYADQLTGTYSMGMQRQTLLAMAMIGYPEFIVLDEPYNGLDHLRILRLNQWIQEKQQRGHSFLISSHDLSIIQNICDRIILLKDGHIKIIKQNEKAQALYLLTVDQLAKAEEVFSRYDIATQVEGDQLIVQATVQRIIELMLQEGIQIQDLEHYQQGLEEVFVSQYQQM